MLKITVQITANASRDEIVGWKGDRLKIKVKAPAVGGKANENLLRFLAEKLDIHRRKITIETGEKSKTKVLNIGAIDEAAFRMITGMPDDI